MKLINLIVTASFAGLLIGCTTLTPRAEQIVVTNGSEVRGCRYLGIVEESSGWGAAAGGIELARMEALNQAAAVHATHVVFVGMNPFFISTVTGKAYRCADPMASR